MLFDKNMFKPSKIKNRFRLVKGYKKGKAKIAAYPVELVLEITNKCNLACVMCPRVNMKRPVGVMDLGLFKNIIDQVKDYIELVYISGGLGEPTIHPKLFDMVKYCRDSNVRVGISTNATLLDAEMTRMLLEIRPDTITLCLDGATKETHEKIRVGSKFEKTMANVEYFLREKYAKRAKNPYAIVQMIYMPQNQAETGLFMKKWQKYKGVDNIRMKKFLHFQGAEYYPETDSRIGKSVCLSCILPWRQLSISWEGKLAICCIDFGYKEEVGNVNTLSISELWNSATMQRYRELLSSGNKNQIELCRNCPGISTSALVRIGCIMFDDLTMRKFLPAAEKLVLKAGIKLADYYD